MDTLLKLWNWLDGRKTKIGVLLLFVYGGFSYVGVELDWLKAVALWVSGAGLVHGAYKELK